LLQQLCQGVFFVHISAVVRCILPYDV